MKETGLTTNTILKNAIDKSDAVIIGAGAGLSKNHHNRKAAGLACDNAEAFNTVLFYKSW
jgi:hypothetical protein